MPANVVSNRLQRVTQWMSCVTSTRGSSFSSCHVSVTGVSTSPETRKSQPARSAGYVGDRAGVEDGPLLGQVLARPAAAPGRTRPRAPSSRPCPGTCSYTRPRERSQRYRPLRDRVRTSASPAPTPRRTSSGWSRTTSRRSRPGEACQALLLTAKARLIAPLTVLRRGADDFLLLTEPTLGDRVAKELLRFRFAAKCAIEAEEHASTIVLGDPPPGGAIPTPDYGVPAYELLDADAPAAASIGERGARAAAHPRPHARLGPRARRPRAPGRGGPRGARDQLHEGVLSRARSRWRGSTTAAIRTGACASSSSRATTFPPTTPS